MDYSLLIMFFKVEKTGNTNSHRRDVSVYIKKGERDEKYIEIIEESKLEDSPDMKINFEAMHHDSPFDDLISPKINFQTNNKDIPMMPLQGFRRDSYIEFKGENT